MPTDPTDDELVARTLAGDREAFGALVARHAGYVHGVARRFAQADPAVDHEDVAQEVFVRAYARLVTYIPGDRFPNWLARVARNYCIDCRRRRSFVLPDRLPARPDPAPGPEELALRRERADAVADAIAALPATVRPAMWLYYGLELGYAEATAALAIPETTLRMRLHRGRQRLREQLATA